MVILRWLAGVVFVLVVVIAIYPWRTSIMQQYARENHNLSLAAANKAAVAKLAQTATLSNEDPRRCQAWIDMGDVCWQNDNLPHAEKILRELADIKNKGVAHSYDPQFAKILLRLAAIHLDQGNLAEAEKNYLAILWYDSNFSQDKPDAPDTLSQPARLARDYDNLGVVHYMRGLAYERKEAGAAEFDKAIEYFDQSLEQYEKAYGQRSQYEANVLYNKSLAVRDRGCREEAKSLLAQSNEILSLTKHSVSLPMPK